MGSQLPTHFPLTSHLNLRCMLHAFRLIFPTVRRFSIPHYVASCIICSANFASTYLVEFDRAYYLFIIIMRIFAVGIRTKSKRNSAVSAFCIYIIFNILNLILHVIGFYSYPMYAQVDYALYFVKIGILYLLYRQLLKNGTCFSKEALLVKCIMILDLTEVFINAFAYRRPDGIIYMIFVLKAVLDFGIIASLLSQGVDKVGKKLSKKAKDKIASIRSYWYCINIAIVLDFIILTIVKRTTLLSALYILLSVRYVFLIYIIALLWKKIFRVQGPEFEDIYSFYCSIDFYSLEKNQSKSEEAHSSNLDAPDYEKKDSEILFSEENLKRIFKNSGIYKNLIRYLPYIKRFRFGLYICIFIGFLYMRNTYQEGKIYLVDENGTVLTNQKSLDKLVEVNHKTPGHEDERVYEYNLCNLMPSWSIFYHEKYGYLNIDTGNDTGAKYDDHLWFDRSGIAYDFDRHFVNADGDEIIEVPYIVKARTSYRQELFNTFLFQFFTNDDEKYRFVNYEIKYEQSGFLLDSGYNYYFVNGVTVYQSDLNGRYGLMKDDGTLITLPEFSYTNGLHDFEVLIVSNYEGTNLSVINTNGDYILKDTPRRIKIYDEARLISYEEDDGYEHFCTYNGKMIDGLFWGSGISGDILCCTKKSEADNQNDTLEVFYGDSEHIFSSDQYHYCRSYADHNGAINYLIVQDKDGKYCLIDLDGNMICPRVYKDYYCTSDDNTLIGIYKNGRIDIIHLDGTIISTSFIFEKMSRDYSTILVHYQDDYNKFYIDLEGNPVEK